MYEKRNRNYYFSIHLIFYRAHQVPQYYKNGQFTIFFCRFTTKDIYSQKKNSKLRQI